jgi:hypothetical protein
MIASFRLALAAILLGGLFTPAYAWDKTEVRFFRDIRVMMAPGLQVVRVYIVPQAEARKLRITVDSNAEFSNPSSSEYDLQGEDSPVTWGPYNYPNLGSGEYTVRAEVWDGDPRDKDAKILQSAENTFTVK